MTDGGESKDIKACSPELAQVHGFCYSCASLPGFCKFVPTLLNGNWVHLGETRTQVYIITVTLPSVTKCSIFKELMVSSWVIYLIRNYTDEGSDAAVVSSV